MEVMSSHCGSDYVTAIKTWLCPTKYVPLDVDDDKTCYTTFVSSASFAECKNLFTCLCDRDMHQMCYFLYVLSDI